MLHDQVIDQTARLVHFRAGSLSAYPLGSGTVMLRCPVCSSEMLPEPVAGVAAHSCPTCAGVWLTANELRAFVESSTTGRHWPVQHRIVPNSSGPLLTCPACPTGVLQSSSVPPYVVLVCTACRGVFLAALPHGNAGSANGRASDASESPAPGELLLSLLEAGCGLL
jgi:Zn-finger nucleic acid-binding protein